MLEAIVERGNYWIIIILMMTGLYIIFAATNLIKRLVGLSVFQTSVFLFYITLGKVQGGTAPILIGRDVEKGYSNTEYSAEAVRTVAGTAGETTLYNAYSNPLPHVLILTAIVVGVATLAVGLALIVRIREAYGTVEADEVREIDLDVASKEAADEIDPEVAA